MSKLFPGMDPYLEDPAFWRDFHSRFINACSEFLADRLPDEYEARIDEQLRLVEVQSEEARFVLPDVAVTRRSGSTQKPPASRSGLVVTLEPVTIPMPLTQEVRDVWVEILHRSDRSVVTVIELLSPTNKAGAGLADYRAKRLAILEQSAHLVELDLLLGGRRIELRYPLPRADYYAFVTRADHRPDVDVYSWSVRSPLPIIPVPLRSPDPDVPLDLAAVFETVYARGHYARSLRYAGEPPAGLGADDAAWATQLADPRPK